MNAYELADAIEDWDSDGQWDTPAANMLRQQADRIEELEKDLKKYDQLAWDDLNKSKTIWCACGDGITADSGAKCGICASTTQQTNDGCGNCHACLVGVMENGYPVTMQRMIVCSDCGNKRCPKASNHRHQCTDSNEPNQRGSIYTTPQTKPLIDEVLNKAFDYYCETDEGVLRFDFDLRTEWKQEQLQRWKEAFRKAWD